MNVFNKVSISLAERVNRVCVQQLFVFHSFCAWPLKTVMLCYCLRFHGKRIAYYLASFCGFSHFL